MKQFGALFLFFIVNISVSQGIRFENSTFAEALQKAKEQDKLLFVDAYTVWCGPCKWLAREVFPDPDLGDYYNRHFVSLQLDMEKGEGIDFSKKYNITAFPTLLYFDNEGNEIHRLLGAREAVRLLEETRPIVSGENRLSTLRTMVEQSSQVDKSTLVKYLISLFNAGEMDTERLQQLLPVMQPDDWKNPELVFIILTASGETNDCNDDFTQALFANYQALLNVYSDLPDFLSSIESFFYEKLAISFAHKIDDKTYNNSAAETFLLTHGKAFDRKRIELLAERKAKKNQNNFRKLLELDHKIFMKYSENETELNNAAWQIAENAEPTKKELKYAILWAKKSISIDENYYNTDTLAHLLYKSKKYHQAKYWAERAIALGKKVGEDVTLTEILLQKIQTKI